MVKITIGKEAAFPEVYQEFTSSLTPAFSGTYRAGLPTSQPHLP